MFLYNFFKKHYWVAPILLLFIVNVINIANPILERHSFRQTQTAISAYYMMHDGFSLRYWTPVLGSGYSIPFEFPIYQYICSVLAKIPGFNLDIVGRFVSLIFSILCLLVNDNILKRLRFESATRAACMWAICFSPIFLFWSGTFMIESCALFFALASLFYALKSLVDYNKTTVILWFAVITLGLLQKVTTSLFPFGVGFIVLCYACLNECSFKFRMKQLIVFAFLLSPLCIAQIWVHFTDVVKMSNEVAAHKLTSSALQAWNFGTIGQRFSIEFWRAIFLRVVLPGSCLGLLVPLCIHTLLISQNKTRYILVSLLILFLGPWLLFTNLYFVHDYYQYSVIIYFSDFVILGLLCSSYFNFRRAKFLALLSIYVVSISFFVAQYFSSKFVKIDNNYKTLEISNYISKSIGEERSFMLIGYDWSSEVGYYSNRKSFSVPDWYLSFIDFNSKDLMHRYGVEMIIICPNQVAAYSDVTKALDENHTLIGAISNCNIYR